MGFLQGIGVKLAAVLAAIVTAVGIVGTAFMKGRKQGKDEVVVKETGKALKRAVEAAEVEDEVEKMSDDDVDRELADSGWMRDDTPK